MPRKRNSDYKTNFDKGQPENMPPPVEGESTSLFNSDPNAPPDAHFDRLDADTGSLLSDVPKDIRARELQPRPAVPGDPGIRRRSKGKSS